MNLVYLYEIDSACTTLISLETDTINNDSITPSIKIKPRRCYAYR